MDQFGNELQFPEKLNAVSTLCARIYKSELFKNLRLKSLDEVGLSEDGYINISLFGRAEKVFFKKRCLYHYRKIISGGSLTQRKDSKIFEKEKKYYNVLNEYIVKNNLSDIYKHAIDNRLAISLIESGIIIINSKNGVYKSIYKILSSEEYNNACRKLELKYLPIHWKIFFIFAKMRFTFGVVLLLKAITKLMNRK